LLLVECDKPMIINNIYSIIGSLTYAARTVGVGAKLKPRTSMSGDFLPQSLRSKNGSVEKTAC